MAYLTRANFKTWAGIATGDTSQDAAIDLLLPAVTEAIKNFVDRDFESEPVTQARQYLYDGSGVLEIDDAVNVTQVKVVQSGVIIPATGYQTQTQNGRITWLELPRQHPWAISPEMGFMFNLDQLWWNVTQEPKIEVTATFGWADADVPADVKLAGWLTIAGLLSSNRPNPELDAESIASYSRSWATATAESGVALPFEAKELLTPYGRD